MVLSAMQTHTRARVCVIGSYAKALVVTADRIPIEGETLIGHDYRQTFGGKGSDMAVQAARLDAAVDYIGVIGGDDFGSEFLRLLETEGVSTSGVRTTNAAPTGVGLIIKDTSGHNIIVVDKGANDLFSRDDIDVNRSLIAGARVAIAQLEIPLDTALYALGVAKAAGLTTVLNPAPAFDLTALGVDLSAVDILTPNQGEARVLVGERPDADIPNDEIASRLRALGVRVVVITRGEHGADIFTASSSEHIDAHVVMVVDSNGAGDSFNAGFAVALAEGRELSDAVSFANGTAALSCTDWETIPSYKHRAQVDELIAAQKGEPR
jgi:ribokinase